MSNSGQNKLPVTFVLYETIVAASDWSFSCE